MVRNMIEDAVELACLAAFLAGIAVLAHPALSAFFC